jgi:hypothetical protein
MSTPALYAVQYRTVDGDTFAIGMVDPASGRPQMYAEHVRDTAERTRLIEDAVARINAQIIELDRREKAATA